MGLERPRADERHQVVVVDRLLLEEELGNELDLVRIDFDWLIRVDGLVSPRINLMFCAKLDLIGLLHSVGWLIFTRGSTNSTLFSATSLV